MDRRYKTKTTQLRIVRIRKLYIFQETFVGLP